MISFRFHIVSITAIFLAIAIGVVVGSTYVDNLVVDQLRRRINTVEESVDEARADRDQLESQLESTRDYVDLSAEFAVTDRLTDVPVLITAVRGVDEAAVERTVGLARRAGGAVPGIVWLEPRWALEGDEDALALATIVDGDAGSDRDELWVTAWQAIADELAADESTGAIPSIEERVPAGPPEDSVLGQLEAAGFVSVDSLDESNMVLTDLLGADPRVLLVTGTNAEGSMAAVVPVAAEASVDGGLSTVVADVYVVDPESPARGSQLLDSLEDSLREEIVIVDHADVEPGRVAAVLALDTAANGDVGVHYGLGEGADAVLPGWTEP